MREILLFSILKIIHDTDLLICRLSHRKGCKDILVDLRGLSVQNHKNVHLFPIIYLKLSLLAGQLNLNVLLHFAC